MENRSSFQELGAVQHCFGCGVDNEYGLSLKSYWDGDEGIAEFQPQAFHCAGSREIVYGGLLSCLIDCHSCNLAVAHICRQEGRPIDAMPAVFCVTAQLNISFKQPTPIDSLLTLRARVRNHEGRKIWIDCELIAKGEVRAVGEVLAIRLKEN